MDRTLSCVNRITKGRGQISNKTFVKMLDELGCEVELTYKKKADGWGCGKSQFAKEQWMSNIEI